MASHISNTRESSRLLLKNKVIAGTLFALFGVTVLFVTACGGSKTEPTTTETSVAPTDTPTTSPKNEVAIEVESAPTSTSTPTTKPSDVTSKPVSKPSSKTPTKPTEEPTVASKAKPKPKPVATDKPVATPEPTATHTPVPTPKPTPTPTPTPEPPLFSVSGLSITPSEPAPGEEFIVGVVVNNDGKGAGTHEVRLKIDGAVTKTEVVALGAGTQKEVLFTVSEETVGTYNVEIEDLTATFSIRPALFLEITSPVNQSVVSSSSVEIEGNTLSTAILSINGSLTGVTSSGTFTSALVLEEGVNVIQVVVSDLRGNEIGEILSLIYLP